MDESLTIINENREMKTLNNENNTFRNINKERVIQQRIIGDCDLCSVTIFQDKAEICRIIPINLDGEQLLELQLSNLTPCIDKDSIRIEIKDVPITIQDVTLQTKSQEIDCTMAELQRKTLVHNEKDNSRQRESLLAKLSRLSKQRTVLEKFADRLIKSQENDKMNNGVENNAESGNPPGKIQTVDVFDPKHMETLANFFEMYEKQAEKLDEQMFSTKEELTKIDLLLQSIEKKKKDLDDVRERMKSRELSIFIECQQSINANLFIYYVVDQCSWTPIYDIRIINSESKMKITYHALVQQNTKEDWSEAREINISTVQPPIGGTVPEIGIQKVCFKTSADSKIIQSPTTIAKSRKTRAKSTFLNTPQIIGETLLKSPLYSAVNQTEKMIFVDEACIKIQDSININQLNLRHPTKSQRNQRMSKALSFHERSEKCNNLAVDKTVISKLTARDPTPCYSDDNMNTKDNSDDIISGSRSKNSTLERQDISLKDQHMSSLSSIRSQKFSNKTDLPSAYYNVSRPPGLISSGADPIKIIIGYIDLSPTFEYTSVPKRAPYAYLKALATNTSDYVILPGEANIYIDSSFIGKTDLKTVAPGEDFSCHLGADHRIQISYHPMYKCREGSMPIAKSICIAFKQVIEILNHHSKPIKLTLMDQLPVANEDKIKVVLQEPAIKHPEKYDKSKSVRLAKNFQVEWDLEIGNGEKKEITLKYTVEYPAGECLDLISE